MTSEKVHAHYRCVQDQEYKWVVSPRQLRPQLRTVMILLFSTVL